MSWPAAQTCPALTHWKLVEVCTPDRWLAPAILGPSLRGYGGLMDVFYTRAITEEGEVRPQLSMELIHNKGRTTGAILERHLRNAMTAVVSETVASIMKDGITPPEDGSWPPALIHSLMAAIGGQRMKD
eukprot:1150140-Heterocapsa_arctica.AAC.1